MRKVRAPIADLAEGERPLDASSGHYVARVLRLGAGDGFVAFDPARGVEAECVVVVAAARDVVVKVGPLRPRQTARIDVTWLQGMAKGDKLDAIVRDATELGVTAFVAVASERAVVKLAGERGDARRARWERIAREAARQSGRAEAPRVEGPLGWTEALARATPDRARFVLWEQAETPLAPALATAFADERPLAFAVGPEGGLSPAEAREAEAAGWTLASLGPHILRTETVAAAVLGAVRIFGDTSITRV
ncbi:MAG TPA: 16S rRNA (uracil(1498)-N(3))-methyltransferase [Polyangiaceae bacterium]